MKKIIIGAIAIIAVMNGVALHKIQQLKAEIIY